MINDKNFVQEILGKIKKNNIKPTPKWHFLLRDYVVWFFGALSLIIGSISVSVIIYLMKYNDWDIYKQTSGNLLEFIILTLPYFWIGFLFLFGFLMFYNIKHTKKGYRYSYQMILFFSIVISILLGSLFFYTGVGRAIDDVLGERAPYYPRMINSGMHYWFQPESGRLAGIVVSVNEDKSFVLYDISKNEWQIVRKDDLSIMVENGKPIRVLGKILSDNKFEANTILPPGRSGTGFFRKHKEDLLRGGMRPGMMRENFIRDSSFLLEKDHSQCPLYNECVNK